ncbi:hypothetical protein ES705_12867 [subsurface metagenome]
MRENMRFFAQCLSFFVISALSANSAVNNKNTKEKSINFSLEKSYLKLWHNEKSVDKLQG